jgi:hypothetical protein
MNLPDCIPGYREAVEAEARTREAAFIRVPEFVAGIRVDPLTVRHTALLSQLGAEIEPNAETLELYLWVVSPAGTSRVAHQLRCAWAFFRHGVDAVAESLEAWVSEQFADAPGQSDGSVFRVDNTSWVSRQCDLLASEYGWEIDTVLELPLRVTFQLEREIRRRHDSKAVFFNPSDKVRARWLEKENKNARN